VISALMSFTRADIAYSLVLVWAYIGIAAKHGETTLVATSALIAAGLILVIMLVVLVRKYRSQPDPA
jgi:hypothetical protein